MPMSQSLVAQGSALLATRAERQLARRLNDIRANEIVATARQIAKLDAIDTVTCHAMGAATRVAQLEAVLVMQTPHAQGRLQFIAEAGTIGLGAVVQQTARQVL